MKSRSKWFSHFLRCSLSQRKGRVAVASAAVMLAAAIVVSAIGISSGIRQQLGGELRAYGANVVITAPGGYMDEDALSTAQAQPGVQSATGQLYAAASAEKAQVELMGLDISELRARGWKVQGAWPGPGDALAGANLKSALSLQEGGGLSLEFPSGISEVRITGFIERGGPEDSALIMPLADVQMLSGRPGLLSAILLRAETQFIDKTVASLAASLPGLEVKTLRQVAGAEESFLGKIELLMILVTIVVLIASSICVSSTMTATVLERMEEIGLMKAIGGTGRQIRRFFLAEGAAIGIAGGLAGFVLGYASAQAVTIGAFGSFIGIPAYTVLVAVAMGLAIAFLSSLFPILHALRRRAADILRGE